MTEVESTNRESKSWDNPRNPVTWSWALIYSGEVSFSTDKGNGTVKRRDILNRTLCLYVKKQEISAIECYKLPNCAKSPKKTLATCFMPRLILQAANPPNQIISSSRKNRDPHNPLLYTGLSPDLLPSLVPYARSGQYELLRRVSSLTGFAIEAA